MGKLPVSYSPNWGVKRSRFGQGWCVNTPHLGFYSPRCRPVRSGKGICCFAYFFTKLASLRSPIQPASRPARAKEFVVLHNFPQSSHRFTRSPFSSPQPQLDLQGGEGKIALFVLSEVCEKKQKSHTKSSHFVKILIPYDIPLSERSETISNSFTTSVVLAKKARKLEAKDL